MFPTHGSILPWAAVQVFETVSIRDSTILKSPKTETIDQGMLDHMQRRRETKNRPEMEKLTIRAFMGILVLMMVTRNVSGADNNNVYDPCSDTSVQKSDGFTFGLAFAGKEAFIQDQVQLSPCDVRLGLSDKMAKLAVFRPKVDEISLLTVNGSGFNPADAGGYMVAFAGRKYAARSVPILVTDGTNTITSFTLVLEFHKGVLQNLFWKKFGCDACSGPSKICIDNQDCGVPTSKCQGNGGDIDCNINIQLTFSGTDKYQTVLNSWYEVKNLRRYSLYGLFSSIKGSINVFLAVRIFSSSRIQRPWSLLIHFTLECIQVAAS